MNETPIDIMGLTSRELADAFEARGLSRHAARERYREVFRQGRTNNPRVHVTEMPVVTIKREDETTKFTQMLPAGKAGTRSGRSPSGGLETESVILPQSSRSGRQRNALCLSSQVGCAMGCRFCETAQMGLMRNLTASEIVAQWHAARFHFGTVIRNIVFMGMGEPMDNVEHVIQAIRVLTDHDGPGIAASKIAVSTVGRAEGIRRLLDLVREPGFHRLCLAVSINAPNDEIRSSIMPINRATPMAELREAMLEWPTGPTRRILIEYVVIPGVNNEPEYARELCEYLRPLNCTVNVIPYNPRRDSPWPAPSDEQVERFIDEVAACGQFVTRRRTMGRTLMAACGQLGNPGIRRRKFIDLEVASP